MKNNFTGFKNLFSYSAGMAGWSIMLNTVSVMLIFLYLPPSNSGMNQLVPNNPIVGILTVFSLIMASGRIIDAVTDPLIAWISDRLNTRWGRRVPLMILAVLPAALFSILLFYPPNLFESIENLRWLFFIQAGFYIFLTAYIVPFNALIPELAPGKDAKLKLSMYLSLSYVMGIIIASQIPFLADRFAQFSGEVSRDDYRLALVFMNIIAVILMILPLFVLNEKKYCSSKPSGINVFSSLKTVVSNRSFVLFLIADASFFLTIAIISSGILYYVKVLLDLPEVTGSLFLGGMIILSLLFYPAVVGLASKKGKKILILIAFAVFALLFVWISFMGKLPFSPVFQLSLLAVFAAFPAAVLGILPYAIIAESAEKSSRETGENIEAMFFAVRTFADKFGQTLGITGFAILMVFGKDPGNDTGIRMSAWLGCGICSIAFLVFLFWKE